MDRLDVRSVVRSVSGQSVPRLFHMQFCCGNAAGLHLGRGEGGSPPPPPLLESYYMVTSLSPPPLHFGNSQFAPQPHFLNAALNGLGMSSGLVTMAILR